MDSNSIDKKPGKTSPTALASHSSASLNRLRIRDGLSRGLRRRVKKITSALRPIVCASPLLFSCFQWYIRYKVKFLAGVEYEIGLPSSSYLPQKVFESQSDKDYLSKILPFLADIPESNGQRYFEPAPITIGIIADEFLWDSIRPAADFRYLTPDNWQNTLPGCQILLVASAWYGLHQEWDDLAEPDSAKQHIASEIIHDCKARSIPVIFYSKEDPPNYSRFLPLAKQCDYIFTSCAEVIDDYRKDCGTDKINTLIFSINPLFQNPIGSHNAHKCAGVLFSGSWMAKYPERQRDLRTLFDGVLAAGLPLKIIDRNYEKGSQFFRFDQKYWPYISPSVDHASLQKIHKLYDWAININSVKHSATMFANRGYELQASGVQMISNYSLGVSQRLPNVFIGTLPQEISRILTRYSPEELYERQMMGVRAVMTGETCFDRIAQLLAAADIEYTPTQRRVLVIANEDTPRIRTMFARQTISEKALTFSATVTPAQMEEYDIIAFFSDDMEYEMFYLEDMCNGFKYTASSYITKSAYYDGSLLHEGVEHDYVSRMECKYRTVFWRVDYQPEELLSLAGACDLPGGYSIDHLNYNAKPLSTPDRSANYMLSLIIPVFNNGRVLYGKAFSSLRRSSLFDKMQILLIDSGSTDGYTPNLLQWLAQRYANVQFISSSNNGTFCSCSKGLEMAAAPYICYLDPSSETVLDGLTKLLEEMQRTKSDLAIGNAILLSDKESLLDHTGAYCKDGCMDIASRERLLADSTFFDVMRLQCMLVDRQIAEACQRQHAADTDNQDALFCRELCVKASHICTIPDVVHIFYATTG